MKRVLTSCLVVLICLTAFISGYSKGCYSYATNQDGTLTNDELDIAVSSWLESHGGNIFSPENYRARKTYEAGLIHNFIYGDGGGYDVVRQHINGGAGGNNELRFDYDGFIIQKLNTWLNRKLQNGEFGDGVTLNEDGMLNDDVNNQLYSGIYLESDNGQGSCLVYIIADNTSLNSRESDYSKILNKGTPFIYDNEYFQYCNDNNIGNWSFNVYIKGASVYPISQYMNSGDTRPHKFYRLYNASDRDIYSRYDGTYNTNGHCCVFKYLNDNIFYFGGYSVNKQNKYAFTYSGGQFTIANSEDKPSVNINFYTNNNNNVIVYPDIDADGTVYITPKVNVGVDGQVNYQPYIINEGDTINNVINQYYIDSNTPDKTISYPSDNPEDNGGSGGGNDNPSGGTPPDWSHNFPHLTPDGEGGFNFNFTLPDLNIDWNISGLQEKFPFSIPFDLIHFIQVLNAEPETPEFDWTIDLKIYQWHIDADLHQFDNLASIVRNVEFIGFCITLVLITRRMIKG